MRLTCYRADSMATAGKTAIKEKALRLPVEGEQSLQTSQAFQEEAGSPGYRPPQQQQP